MHHNIRQSSTGKVRFYHKDVLAILLHPYFRKLQDASAVDLTREILRKNLVAVDRELFTGDLEKAIFRPVEGTRDFMEYLRTLFNHILESFSGTGEQMEDALERAFIFHLLTLLNKLEVIVDKRPGISPSMLERFLKKLVGTLRIPFEGEPLSGLQLMGILETRLLDFDHVILLSMNEEVMPAAHAVQSNIPYTLRLAFNMPAKEDKDAIYAYYFYRLLQRARRIDLLFNGATEGVQSGEMSRYLHQLIFDRKVEVIRPGLEVRAREIQPLVIPHTELAKLKLEQYRKEGEEGKYLSPSAVNTYIDCSLKFYLRYIAGIGEPDEISEDMDAAGFGTVVHDTLKELYSEIAERNDRQVSQEELKSLLSSSRLEEVLRKLFKKQHFKGRMGEELEGRNIIIFRVMLRYLVKIIQTDLAIAPFELVSAELDYHRSLQIQVGQVTEEINLGGKIDRLDRVKGMLRVIDYKTGQTLQNFTTLESLFDGDYGSRNGAAMQILFYTWLVGETFQGEAVLPGLYTMKGLFEEAFDPALKMTSLKSAGRIASLKDHEEPFLGLLKEVLERLYDPDIPFVQRKDDKVCSYCDFAELCQRRAID
jgi:CRISPR/Cas system-associated exonuclease Cas4 (RecB family)